MCEVRTVTVATEKKQPPCEAHTSEAGRIRPHVGSASLLTELRRISAKAEVQRLNPYFGARPYPAKLYAEQEESLEVRGDAHPR